MGSDRGGYGNWIHVDVAPDGGADSMYDVDQYDDVR